MKYWKTGDIYWQSSKKSYAIIFQYISFLGKITSNLIFSPLTIVKFKVQLQLGFSLVLLRGKHRKFHPYIVIDDHSYIGGPLWYHINTCLKRGLIHQDRDNSVIRPLLYLQATTAGYIISIQIDKYKNLSKKYQID